jgi:hypothetical protein
MRSKSEIREYNAKYSKDRRKNDPKFRERENRNSNARYHSSRSRVLTHYGKDGKAMCCWPGCFVEDMDMLTLDHVFGGGRKHRETHNANKFLNWIIREGFPEGFQTLCWNHQWKKFRTARCNSPSIREKQPYEVGRNVQPRLFDE